MPRRVYGRTCLIFHVVFYTIGFPPSSISIYFGTGDGPRPCVSRCLSAPVADVVFSSNISIDRFSSIMTCFQDGSLTTANAVEPNRNKNRMAAHRRRPEVVTNCSQHPFSVLSWRHFQGNCQTAEQNYYTRYISLSERPVLCRSTYTVHFLLLFQLFESKFFVLPTETGPSFVFSGQRMNKQTVCLINWWPSVLLDNRDGGFFLLTSPPRNNVRHPFWYDKCF